ncbi:MAG TPA: hypothetical protein VGQ35_21840, partial [Dongiaceae bacterium]|nr:hypothetical protein [Dongiaceae bacterium]
MNQQSPETEIDPRAIHRTLAFPSAGTMETLFKKVKRAYSRRARTNRAAMFRRLFPDAMNQRILDLGGGDGGHIALVV